MHQGLVCPLSPPIESQTTATQEANYDFNIIANETKVDGTCLNNKEESASTLLQIQTLKVGKQRNKLISINALWDAGSQLSFITFQLAKDLMLEGKPVALEIETVGGEFRKINSYQYTTSIQDMQRNIIEIKVLGIEKYQILLEILMSNK